MHDIQFLGKRVALSDVRKTLKSDLENEQLLGSQLFEVWINESAVPIE
jgi:hypothetical protein